MTNSKEPDYGEFNYGDEEDDNEMIPTRQSGLKVVTSPATTTTTTTTTAAPASYDDDYDWGSSGDGETGESGVSPKVVGGTDAWNGQFPHQVSLQNHKGHFCGASIINPLLLLTAAHCLTNTIHTEIRAVTGAHKMNEYNESVQFRDVVRAIQHEKYNETTWDNDIAILVLNESLVFDNFTQAVDIWERGAKDKKGAHVSGWGIMGNLTEEREAAEVLQFALVRFISDRNWCQKKYANLQKKLEITENMLCAGGNKADSCQGDSGGPLSCFKYSVSKNPDQVYLCGIVSFGVGCQKNVPGIYTDVSKYYGWINKHMPAGWRQHYMTLLGKPLAGGDQCDMGMFRCKNSGACIPEEFKCDGVNDCDPLTEGVYDEAGCTSITCPSGKFQCDNSTCLPFDLVCDGKSDCQDETDEICT